MKHLLLVGFGGFIGSVARYLVSKLSLHWAAASLPLGTITVNVLGSLLIGLLIGLSAKNNLISSDLRLFLIVGFCGGFTTFSTFSAENLILLQNGQFLSLLLYTSASVILGLLAVYIGYVVIGN